MPYQFDAITVLVVEDNKPMLELVKSLLSTFGVENVITAVNGDEAFTKYCQSQPDLVITDWMMRPVDGIALTRRIRNDPDSPNQFTPIVLMTGFSEQRRAVQARDSGVSEFLVKPFNARDLYRRLAQIIENPRQFVRSEDFFGPDRRRHVDEAYKGEQRRKDDPGRELNEIRM